MQDLRRFKSQNRTDRRERGDQHGKRQQHKHQHKHHRTHRNAGTEYHVSHDLRDTGTQQRTDNRTNQRNHSRLSEHQARNRTIGGTNRLQQRQFGTAFANRGGHQIRHCNSGRNQRKHGHQHHHRLRFLQHIALQCGHLTHLLGYGTGNNLFDLIGDGRRVRGAIPRFPLILRERIRILRRLTGQIIVRRGQSLDFDLVDGIRQIRKHLRSG